MSEMPYSDSELVQRVMMNIVNHEHVTHPRWVLVMRAFGFGSAMAVTQCTRFGFDPDELLPGRKVEA